MSAPEHEHEHLIPTEPAARRRFWRRFTLIELALFGGVALIALLFVAGVGGRLAVLTPWGRAIAETLVSGQKLGRFGQLQVSGLRGDLWHDFTLERATISDGKGVWVQARNIHVRWRAIELFARRFHAQDIVAANVQVLRRPELTPDTTPPGPPPVSVKLDKVAAQLDLMEGFGKIYGHWLLSGDADVHRVGQKKFSVMARSVTRPGDFLQVAFDGGGKDRFDLNARAFEAQGGPLAGGLGYSAHDAFVLNAQAHGAPSAGKFAAAIQSGRYLPLNAEGVWNTTGAIASGQVALSGSELLKPAQDRLGDQARFGLAARRQTADRFAIGLTLLTENATSHAQGVIDTKSQTAPDGLLVDVQTASVTRLLKTKLAGAGRFQGVVQGGVDGWHVKGNVALADVSIAGYGLATVNGPIEAVYANKRLDARIDARGAGGAGNSWLAGLLGAKPTATAMVSRLEDGRLLLTSFEGKGTGLEVRGSGSRGLFGGLNFKGRVTLANAGVAHAGAHGAVDSPFEASQTGPGKPWRISLDARGRGFATGYDELDRLLGDAPRLTAEGSLDKGRINLDSAVLSGRVAQVKGSGLIGLDGDLKVALNWTAKGPFEAGPVEVAGNASGVGALTGQIAAPRADLKAHFDQIDVGELQLLKTDVVLTFQRDPRGYDGRVAVVGSSPYGPARGASDFRFAGDGVSLDDLAVDAGGVQARGSLALRNGAPSAADLAFTAGPGAFLTGGHAQGHVRIADAAAAGLGNGALVDVTGTDVAPRGMDLVFHTLRLNGQGTLARLPFSVVTDIGGAQPIKFTGTGVYAHTAQAQTVTLEGGGQIRRATFKTLSPFSVAFTDHGRAVKGDLSVGGGHLTLSGQTAGQVLDARANLSGVDLSALGEGVYGRVDAALVLTGRDGHLGGTLDAKLAGVSSREGPKAFAVDGVIKASLGGEHLHIDAQAFDRGGSVKANTTLDLPVVDSVAPLHLAVARDRGLSGRYAISGEVKPIWDLFLGGDRTLAGQVQSQGVISGTLNQPLIQGSASVRNGRFEDSGTGLVLRNLTGDVDFDREAARVHGFQADDGKNGHVTGEGVIELAKGGASDFSLNLKNFQAIDNDIATARATGAVKVTRGADGHLKLAGALTIDQANIQPKLPASSGVVSMDVVEINAPPGRTQFKAPKHGQGAALDLTLKAARGVFLRGRGLDLEFGLDAHVTGTTNNPQLAGMARVTRGDFNFSGQRFQFDDRGTVSLSTDPNLIRLDLKATRDDPSLTATVAVRGTAAKPEVTLTSDPALPQDEILSQVLFGTSAAQLSPVEAAQLASAVASLGGGKGFDVLGDLRELAGLDRLVFAGDASTGGITVAGGKYVSDRVYLELIGGGKEGEAVQLEWRAAKHLSILSRIGGGGDARLSVRWRKDLKH